MALDLATGIVAISALSVLAFSGGRRLSARSSRSIHPLWLAASLLLALLFAWTFSGNLGWAVILPIASVVFWSNLMPILLSFAAGLACKTPGITGWHRVATTMALLLLAAAYTLTPVARPLLAPAETSASAQWRGDGCLQSHASTCAPAAAVTLLRFAGVQSDEGRLVDVCLTSRVGTEPLGLFRGLAIASGRSPCRPRVASRDPDQWIRSGQLPNVALVRLAQSPSDASLRRFLGPAGEGHAVVVCGCDARGNWLIEDPAFGRTIWTDQQLHQRFTGDAIFLARR